MIGIGDVFAGVAILVSLYTYYKTVKLNETQTKLNLIALEKHDEEILSKKKADMRAMYVKSGGGSARLILTNYGAACAKNVSIEFPHGNDCVISSELERKLPVRSLEKGEDVELIAAMGMSSNNMKQLIVLTWADEFSQENKKTVELIA